MAILCSLVAAMALGAAADADLSAAEKAFDEGRYEAVLPAVQRALKRPLDDPQRRRAHELEAMTGAAFEDSQAAIEAFRKVLGVDPAYTPGPSASPKILGLLEEARRRGPVGARLAPQPAAGLAAATGPFDTTPPPAAPQVSLTRRWWFWAGVGVIAAGAGAGAFAATRPQLPAGNLGTGQLR